MRYFLSRREGRQEIVKEGGIIAAGGFKQEFAGSCALIVAFISHVDG